MDKNDITLVILAAGIGSRFGGLKQIEPVGLNGEAIIDFSVFDAVRCGFSKLVFVIRPEIEEAFRNFAGKKYEKIIETQYAYQTIDKIPAGFTIPEGRTKPWGTGHALLCAKEQTHTPFAVINGDDFYGKEAFETIAEFLSTTDAGKPHWTMAGYHLRNTLSDYGTVSRGICKTNNERMLAGITEHTKISKTNGQILSTEPSGKTAVFTGDETVSVNFFGFTPVIFSFLETQFVSFLSDTNAAGTGEFFLPSAVSSLIHRGNASVEVRTSGSSWFGVTYREDKAGVTANIQAMIKSGMYPERLWT